MNTTDAEHVLRMRLDLTEARYSRTTVETWAASLSANPQADVIRAMRALVATGERDINPATIHGWLRDEHRREVMATGTGQPTTDDPGCHCTGTLCDMHRRIGIDAIARIRATRKAAP